VGSSQAIFDTMRTSFPFGPVPHGARAENDNNNFRLQGIVFEKLPTFALKWKR
jgi:hypothetical protein